MSKVASAEMKLNFLVHIVHIADSEIPGGSRSLKKLEEIIRSVYILVRYFENTFVWKYIVVELFIG
jgi:hypothetical protein